MLISYWSSDVCSSDLLALLVGREQLRGRPVVHADRLRLPAVRRRAGAAHAHAARGAGERLRLRRILRSAFHAARQRDDVPLRGADPGGGRDSAAAGDPGVARPAVSRSEEHTSELQSLMRISYAVFCLKKKNK